jgi:hypothetical protein
MTWRALGVDVYWFDVYIDSFSRLPKDAVVPFANVAFFILRCMCLLGEQIVWHEAG